MKTALTQLEKWITEYQKVNGTPTICEIMAQIEMMKDIEKEHLLRSNKDGWLQGVHKSGDYENAEDYFAKNFHDSF